MFGLIKTWKALEAKGIMGINRRNADYVLKYNKRSLYPIVDDKIITKQRAIEAGIHVPEMYGIIETEKDIDKLKDIVKDHTDFVVKPAQGAGGDGIRSDPADTGRNLVRGSGACRGGPQAAGGSVFSPWLAGRDAERPLFAQHRRGYRAGRPAGDAASPRRGRADEILGAGLPSHPQGRAYPGRSR